MYHNPGGGPFLPPTATRGSGQQGVAGSPKGLSAGVGSSFSPPPTHGGVSPGPGSGGFANGPGASPSFNGAGAGGSFQVPSAGASFQLPNTAGSFQMPNNSPSFQLPSTAGSLQPPSACGSFANVGSFAAPGARLPLGPAPSFSVPALLGGPGGALGPPVKGQAAGHGSFEDAAAGSSVTRPLTHGLGHGPPGGKAHGHGPPGGKAHGGHGQCEDQQCAEEECDPEECGDESRAPREDAMLCCGYSRRPMLPLLLVSSTVTGAVHSLLLQFPLARGLFDGAYFLRAFFLILYVATLGCMGYCAMCDPGQLKREDQRQAYARLQQVGGSPAAAAGPGDGGPLEDPPLPKRCHKTWLLPLPVRRYDHYCRWLMNCIGLLNHREFIVMVSGLVAIGVCGALLDLFLVAAMARQGGAWIEALLLLLHLAYSVCLVSLAGPIFRLHVGFISRNELANEWKRNDFYVITRARTGESVPVNDLSDDEFNERFDAFEYDKKRNAFDKDPFSNCWTFWCTPRWAPGQLGEF